jgi:hypothetical protein
MDFDFKWWIVGFAFLMAIGVCHDTYKAYLTNQIELAKIQYNKCECK